ncbi:MAG TPA: TatD family hydrolase [Bacteroidales bacterium]|nr:TatD family hydrolase [Bacteroidales bacterium]
MKLIDTHAHLYLGEFDNDREAMMQRAMDAGVQCMLLPNIDTSSIAPMLEMCSRWPGHCYPMMGLHPTYVGDDYSLQLEHIGNELFGGGYVAVGEIGIDLYWDKTYFSQQEDAFIQQLGWAAQLGLPVAIHTREAFHVILDMVEKAQDGRLSGVFHCFTGSVEEAKRIMDLGFYFGIGGVLTYKKSDLPKVVQQISPDRIVLETDSPYLPPVPHRGKRNESAFLTETAHKLAEVYETTVEEIASSTTNNAIRLFKIEVQ